MDAQEPITTLKREEPHIADQFHVVKLANLVLDETRRRVQIGTCGHRGRKTDPLYRIRKLMIAHERLDTDNDAKLRGLLEAGDPDGQARTAGHAKEVVCEIYTIDDPNVAGEFVAQLGIDLHDESCPPEVQRLGRTIVRWRHQIAAWHRARHTNGPTEAIGRSPRGVSRYCRGLSTLMYLPYHKSVKGLRLRRMAVESPGSLGATFRRRRWQMLLDRFPGLAGMNVVDLGGTTESWLQAPVKPRSVTIVNLSETGTPTDESIIPVLGDACNATEVLVSAGIDPTFDLVYCNSVIEHVGGHVQRTQLAHEVQRLASRHWVQTPYRYFPVEPHWVCPLMQFLPVAASARIAYFWPLAYARPASLEQARDEILWTELQSATHMRTYFPSSILDRERVAGITKSLIAHAGP